MTKVQIYLDDMDKYKFPKLHKIEADLGEPSDRTAFDVGTEMELKNVIK